MSWLSYLPNLISRGVDAATFGATDRFAQFMTGASNDQLAQMRQQRANDTGTAGDVAEAVGTIVTPLKILQGAKAVRAAGGVQSARGAQILGQAPAAAVPGVRQVIRNNPVKATLGAVALTGLANGNRRAAAEAPAAGAGAAVPADLVMPDGRINPAYNPPEIAALPKDARGNRSVQTPAGLRAVDAVSRARGGTGSQIGTAAPAAGGASSMSPFQQAIQAAGGEGLSLNELTAMAAIHNNARDPARAAPKAPSAKDQAGALALSQIQSDQQELAAARAANPNDPNLAAMEAAAQSRSMQMLRLVLGAGDDPLAGLPTMPE